MATQVQLRRGTTAQTASFTGATAEITVDSTKNTIVVHDGSTVGGFALAKESALSTNATFSQAAFTQANAAFLQANTPSYTSNSAASYANAAFGTANSAFAEADSAASYANSGFITANSAGVYANSAFAAANAATATDATQNTNITSAATYANGAFVTANNAVTSSNGTIIWETANSAASYANSAFVRANNSLNVSSGGSVTGSIGVSGNIQADYVVANTGFASAAGSSKLQLSDIGLVTIDVAGVQTKFGASGIESSPGIYGGTFGGNKLSLNSETNLISNRGDVVKIQTGTTGTTVNDFVFANNSLTVPGGITANGFTAGGINVVPTLVASFSAANAAFTRANNSLNANTGGTVSGDVSITGNLTVTGLTTYTNTTTVLIADNIITVNAAINQAAQPAVNAGIEVDRGAQPNSSFLWIETSGKWSANNGNGSIFIAADSAESYANAAFASSNLNFGVDLTQNTNITNAGTYANAAFLAANTPSYVANSAAAYANSGFAVANSGSSYANSAFAVANNGVGIDTTQNTNITSAASYANSGFAVANSASLYANSAYVRANNSLNANTGGTIAGQIAVDGGTYGNVTITQFASVYGQANAANPYSIVQVKSNDYVTGMGMQVYAGLNGLLYSNTGIQFNTSTIVRDKDYPTGGTNAGQFAANGAFIAQASLASTSNATGSIQVVGGVGIKGNVAADGIIFPDNTRQTTAADPGSALAFAIALG